MKTNPDSTAVIVAIRDWAKDIPPDDKAPMGVVLGLYLSRVSPDIAEAYRHQIELEWGMAWGKPPEFVERMLMEQVRKAFMHG